MIKISEIDEKCCMLSKEMGRCKALTVSVCEGNKCEFYKPVGCGDMIRTEVDGEMYLAKPEELGLIRCSECKCSRANPNMGSPLECMKYPNAKLKMNSYCSHGERI